MGVTVNYNPDILSCLANLSNDEVFTPPELVNRILDILPSKLWSNPNTRILDPCSKTGVFLREIAKRMIEGEKEAIPDLQKRIDHIFHKQLYGIAITELTSLLSRRSLYCSKMANGSYSVSQFKNPSGNIIYRKRQHTWNGDKCIYCNAAKAEYDRPSDLESYAYEFIHLTDKEVKELSDMHFDLIIGNPPYQLGSNDDRSTSRDKPIYNLFIKSAMKLSPKYITMIIPSRWMTSGLGLKDFRDEILHDRHIKELVDYPISSEVFAGVEVKGGICYFLRDRNYDGPCHIRTFRNEELQAESTRYLDEFDVLVRDSRALPILHKVLTFKEPSINTILSVDKEFGWTSNFRSFHKTEQAGDVPIYYNEKGKRYIGYIPRTDVMKSTHLIDTWKVMVPQAGSDGGQKIPDVVLGSTQIAPNPSVCTQTYLFFHVDTKEKAQNLDSYLHTKFFRYLVSLRKITQHATHSTYLWVPIQDFSKPWTDEELYKKYGLDENEIALIEMMIKPMDISSDSGDAK